MTNKKPKSKEEFEKEIEIEREKEREREREREKLYKQILESGVITKDIKFFKSTVKVMININVPIASDKNSESLENSRKKFTKYDLDKINETFYFYNDNNEVMLKKDGQYHLIGTPNQLNVYKQVYYDLYQDIPLIELKFY